jgi:hypothetical protein
MSLIDGGYDLITRVESLASCTVMSLIDGGYDLITRVESLGQVDEYSCTVTLVPLALRKPHVSAPSLEKTPC